ncbi:uncharacterized protein [Periplaneta americana]|uniref:uncharacterized protein n=1 Tax=Periplaneta americana TaxID=6978 RepID=UPI0037E97D0D
MDVIKMEPEIDPLAVQMSDNTNVEEKKPLSEERNLFNEHMIGIKEECVDQSYITSDMKDEETKEADNFDFFKCEVQMPGKTTAVRRKTWDPQRMKEAILSVRSGQMGYLRAAKTYGVPKGTVEKYVKDRDKTPEDILKVRSGRKPVLPPELENMLVKYCLQMDERFFGLRVSDMKRMAFELAIRNGLQHPFSANKGSAGKKWFRLFLKRHPILSLRTPQGVSAARIKSFNPENVAVFFDIYERELEKVNFDGHRVYNVGETGLTVVQHKYQKVVSMRGKKQISNLTSTERGALITIVTCMNATGNFVPPLFVFPRKNMKAELMDGAPPGSISGCHTSGWVQTNIFSKWFDHFIKFIKPSESNPVILVLDAHYSHTRNIEVIEKGRSNHVAIICLPPHSTAKMQPLDVCFMKPLKTYYAQEISTWLRHHPGRVVTHYQVASLFGLAYQKAATMQNSMNAFRKCGLIPCNRNIFANVDFAIHEGGWNDETVIPGSEHFVGPVEISPLPQLQKQQQQQQQQPPPQESQASTSGESQVKSSRAGKAALITSSPYQKQLRESLYKAKQNKDGAHKRLFDKQQKSQKNRKVQLKKHNLTSFSDEDFDEEMQSIDSSDSEFEGNDDDAECLFCTGLFSDDTRGEKWVQCSKCRRWAHEDCGADEEHFICSTC